MQYLLQASPREYRVLFDNGNEETLDISRIARKVEGRLRMWEGVRVCALYRPKYVLVNHCSKCFYSF